MAEQATVDEVGKAILRVLTQCREAAGCGEIAAQAGLPTPKVMGKLRGLLKSGLVATPERGKYVITEAGKRHAG